MEGKSVRSFAVVFSGLGSVAVLCVLGALWLLQVSGSLAVLVVAAAHGLMVVSSLMGLLACFRFSRDLQLDRDTEVRDLFGYAVCCLLLPFVVDLQLMLSAVWFPLPVVLFAERELGMTEEQAGVVLMGVGTCSGVLAAVIAGTAAYGVVAHKQWNLSHDSLLLTNTLLLLLSECILLWTIQTEQTTFSTQGAFRLTKWTAILGIAVAYIGWSAVHTSSLGMLRGYLVLVLVLGGLSLISALDGWVASQKSAISPPEACFDSMAIKHADALASLHCESKYSLLGDSESLDCPKSEIRLAWDLFDAQFGCLNSTCCTVATRYSQADSECLGALQVACMLLGGFAVFLVLVVVKQIEFDDKEHFGDHCLLLIMLLTSVALGTWYLLWSGYPTLPTTNLAGVPFVLPERLLTRGGCVKGVHSTGSDCSKCNYAVTADNGIVYDAGKPIQKANVQGWEALQRLLVCPACISSPLTIFVTQGSGSPEVHTYDWSGQTRVAGSVQSERDPLDEVTVKATVNGCSDLVTLTGAEGSFAFLLPSTADQSPYNVTLRFQKDGYSAVSRTMTIGGLLNTKEVRLPPVRLAASSLLFSSVALYVFDATTNSRMKEATVDLREGYNNFTGPAKDSLPLSPDGLVMFEDLRAGVYTLTSSKPGWFSGLTDVVVAPNTHQEKAVLMSPAGSVQLRFVLGWDSAQDLDLRVSFDTDVISCEVSFAYKLCGGAQLHTDNQYGGSSGGEVLTLSRILPTTYSVAVSRFETSNFTQPLGASGAEVSVYVPGTALPILRVPVRADAEDRWAALCVYGQRGVVRLPDDDGYCTGEPVDVGDYSGWAAHP